MAVAWVEGGGIEGRDVGEAARGRSQIADLQFAICNLQFEIATRLSPPTKQLFSIIMCTPIFPSTTSRSKPPRVRREREMTQRIHDAVKELRDDDSAARAS